MKRLTLVLPTLYAAILAVPAHGAPFELKKGDHICIIGNSLAERMQHDGWLETLIQARYPHHELVFRNLGFSGDEVGGFTDDPDPNCRLRTLSFGTADQWLGGSAPVPEPNKLFSRIGVRDNRFETTHTNADVIFAFFGYNESFSGEAGLDKFRTDLAAFIKHAESQRYNGKGAPRLVLMSPTAFEDLNSPNLPDGKDVNQRLSLYAKAMADVARVNDVRFVSLFEETRAAFRHALPPPAANGHDPQDWTINGVHLTEPGDHVVAKLIDESLFGPVPQHDEKALEKLRQAVIDKNFYWFGRYRVMDGYNVYGSRAFEKYTDKQSNYEDQQRELEILDVKTSNRDRRVWAVAQGHDLKVDDSNCPPLIPVKTNKPGAGPNGENVFVDGEAAIRRMTVAKGMKVTLFASEKEFPELAKPAQMQFDAKGRLWVAAWPSYPHWKPTEERNDKILIFEDTTGTGKANKMTVFADHLNCPTGFEFYNGGVIVAQAPELLFLKDTKGTGKADLRVVLVSGIDSADSHHTANSFTFGPGGGLYYQEGTFNHTQVETPYGPPVRCINGGVLRYEPRTQKLDVYISAPFGNPHGHVWDRWGQDIVFDGTPAQPFHGALFSGRVDFPNKHPRPPQVYQQWTRPCPGAEILSSRLFPDSMQDNLLVANVIGFQGILQYTLMDKGSSFAAREVEPIISSTDPNFRPADLKIGPDGAIWFIDWHNPIIGHLQHAIRDPNRDRTHGRIYRITYEGRQLSKSPTIDGEPIEQLLELLKEPENRLRYRVRTELAARDTHEVMTALARWVKSLELAADGPSREQHLMEALWLCQSHNVADKDLLARMLRSSDFHARAAATRVLCYWRTRVPEALELLKQQAADPHPRVRLEAVRAASFFTVPKALEIVLIAGGFPSDIYLDFVVDESKKVLEPPVKTALARGDNPHFTTDAGARYLLHNVPVDRLLKMERTERVCLELLERQGVSDDQRRAALRDLATIKHKPELNVLLEVVSCIDRLPSGGGELLSREASIVLDLMRLLGGHGAMELSGVRPELEKLALASRKRLIRQAGLTALINVDGSADRTWQLALGSVESLRDLVLAMPLIGDPGARADLYPKVEKLLDGLPPSMMAQPGAARAVSGRYVRVELRDLKTLSLAEVEVFSNGQNIARKGKASQKDTFSSAAAGRAIDGNVDGRYASGTVTQTVENTPDPWWQVDLGREAPIDQIVIWNRTDENLGKRLDGFTLRVLDTSLREVWRSDGNPAPARDARFDLGGSGPVPMIRHAAMEALTSVRGQEPKTFQALAKFIKDEGERTAAIRAIQRIPHSFWPRQEAQPLLDIVLAAIKKIPAKERTAPEVLDTLEFADALAALLPPDQSRKVRRELGELGVRVVRIGTLPERMTYDKEMLVVKAGKPVEFIFENTDLMPHNFVIAAPGSLEQLGKMAEAAAQQPDSAARQFVPMSPNVLLASRLLQPREAQELGFKAPAAPGVYPYVCTYPGHWMRMHGALYVVDDLEAYQADPQAYLAEHPLEIKDPLLQDQRPRTEWRFEDLATVVGEMKSGRDFSNGKQMFTVATCIACHKMEETGAATGPDLKQYDPKFKRLDMLKDIIEPSFRINDKFQSWTIEVNSGKKYTGLIVEETKQVVKLVENPLVKTGPLVIKVNDIVERTKSPISIMPKGLLDKLTRDEILDLFAYVWSKGNKDNQLFKAQAHHH